MRWGLFISYRVQALGCIYTNKGVYIDLSFSAFFRGFIFIHLCSFRTTHTLVELYILMSELLLLPSPKGNLLSDVSQESRESIDKPTRKTLDDILKVVYYNEWFAFVVSSF